jgi:predicted nucleic acid-binding protein
MKGVILDTSVMMDILLKDREAHDEAARLAKHLIERNVPIAMPMHAFFELTSAIMCEKRTHGGSLVNSAAEVLNENRQLKMVPVPIDLAFVNKYATGEAPDLRSGDMIFVVLAKVDGLDLITEDDKMLKEAKRLGVSAYRIAEYLSSCV